MRDANFAQTDYRPRFSKTGREELSKIAGRPIDTIDDLVRAIKDGLDPSKIPVNYIMREGKAVMLNTRTTEALRRAGVPRSRWNGVDRTGQPLFEKMLDAQLLENGLPPIGTPNLPVQQ